MKYPETARRLKETMDECGIISQELADKSGVHKSSISQYLSGSHKPSNISSGKMATVLNVNPVWLMGFDVPKQITKIEIHHVPVLQNLLGEDIAEMVSVLRLLGEDNRLKVRKYAMALLNAQEGDELLRMVEEQQSKREKKA